jgi:hypothetical protein
VCGPGANREFFDFWRKLLAAGEPHPPVPLVFPTIQAACERLGLSDAAREALERAITTSLGDGARHAGGRNAAEGPPGRSAGQA